MKCSDKWLKQQIQERLKDLEKTRKEHCLDQPFDMPSVPWHEAYGEQQGLKWILGLLDERDKELRDLLKQPIGHFPMDYHRQLIKEILGEFEPTRKSETMSEFVWRGECVRCRHIWFEEKEPKKCPKCGFVYAIMRDKLKKEAKP